MKSKIISSVRHNGSGHEHQTNNFKIVSKKIFIVAMLTFFGMTQAQVTFKPGIQAGVNFSKLHGLDVDSKSDFYVGAFGEIGFSKQYAFQPEITYSRQGAKGHYDFAKSGYSASGDTDISLQYLSIALNNKITIYKGLYLILGEFNDFLIGNEIYEENSTAYSKGYDIDFGVFGGLGYKFPKGFAIDARFKKGFNDAFDDETGYKSKITNQVFQFGVSYTFFKK